MLYGEQEWILYGEQEWILYGEQEKLTMIHCQVELHKVCLDEAHCL
jgi:hypothetical protein